MTRPGHKTSNNPLDLNIGVWRSTNWDRKTNVNAAEKWSHMKAEERKEQGLGFMYGIQLVWSHLIKHDMGALKEDNVTFLKSSACIQIYCILSGL